MSKRKPTKRAKPKALVAARSAPELALISLMRLEAEDPFLLAAFIDWIREEWRGEKTLANLLCRIDDTGAPVGAAVAVQQIEARRTGLKADALKYAAEGIVHTAVTA